MEINARINEIIKNKKALTADGATGTNLFKMGLDSGYPPEMWNIEKPENVASNHRNFITAGSDIILTNSFGANKYRLSLHNMEDRVYELNYEAARIAKKVTEDFPRDIIVAGSIGPTGELISPLGELSENAAIDCFFDQASALREGGAEIIWIETMSSIEEMECAIIACMKTKLPIICTYSFDSHGKTMMGLEPKDLIELAEKYYPDVIGYGANCGIGTADIIASLICLARDRNNKEMHLVVKGNCGIPELIEGKIEHKETPEHMGMYAKYASSIGAKIIGGCCGATSCHIREIDKNITSDTNLEINIDSISKNLGEITSGNINLMNNKISEKKKRNTRLSR